MWEVDTLRPIIPSHLFLCPVAVTLTVTKGVKIVITQTEFLCPPPKRHQIVRESAQTAWQTKQAGIATNVER